VEGSRTLRREIRRLAEEEDLTVVVSSHDMRVIEDVCDRVIVMSEGSVVADDAVERLLGTVEEYRVRVASDDLSAATIDDLRGRFNLTDADAGADPPSLEVVTDGDAVYDLFDALRAAGVTLDRVETVEPTLEDVFVRLTGDRGATKPTPSAAGREPGGATNRPAAAVGDEGSAQ